MADPGELTITADTGVLQVHIRGDWTLAHYPRLLQQIRSAALPEQPQVDLSGLQALDTAGAALLVWLLAPEHIERLSTTAPELPAGQRKLLQFVAEASASTSSTPPHQGRWRPTQAISALGAGLSHGAAQLRLGVGFMGMVLATFATRLPRPQRWRLSAVSSQLQHTALEAVPIVALLTFAVGAVVGLLGITVLGRFGAAIFTVELVAYAFLREFGVVLTAILLAGRSASAFTAQLGSMKANEELDAMRAQGLSPIEMLVIPRVAALLLALPLLTVLAVACGLSGGGLVILLSEGVPVGRIVALYGEVALEHYLAGLVKAPLFAFVIAIIGCLEGFKSGASAQSVGIHTTSAVVQSIFWVIILDAAAALLFVEVGW
ncbi:MAG: ABC transporter permease [Halorhodospira sp.]